MQLKNMQKNKIIGLLWGLLACLLITICCGCKSNDKIVDAVHYVHDTAFVKQDSVVYRFAQFNGTDEEKTATWTTRDTERNVDTIFKYRYRVVRTQSRDTVYVQKVVYRDRVVTDRTSSRTVKAGPVRKKRTRWPIILLVVAGVCVGAYFLQKRVIRR